MVVRIAFSLGVMVVLLTACTTTKDTATPTATPAAHVSSSSFHTTLKTSDGVFLVQFSMTPHRYGPNMFIVDLKNARSGKLPADEQVQIFTTMLDMDMGTGVIMLQPDGNGRYSAQGTLPMDGKWDIHIQLLDNAVHVAKLKLYVPA